MHRSPAPSGPVDLPLWPPWALALLLVGVTILAYLPAFGAGFIWDDDGHLTRPDLQSWEGLLRIWFQPGETQQYYPLLHTAFWIEHRLWGDHPAGYHAINVLLHATAACLFALVLRRLALHGAWLAALLFALHPVGVESVAWISEQKNTLSAVLYLGATLAYLRFEDKRSPRRYALATALFVLALLTKTVTATLPAALLVLAWWRRGRIEWRADVRPLVPWFTLAVGAGLFTAWFEHTLIGAQGREFALSLIERGLLAGRVIWFYLGKLVWPAELIFIYPRWEINGFAPWQYLYPLGVLGLLAGLFWHRHRGRGPLAAFLLFTGTLFPVLGFVNVYPFIFSYVADHFQYLASLSFFALVGAASVQWSRRSRPAVILLAGVALTSLGILTWRQSGMYRDVFVLYRTTLERNPASWMAHHNLALALTEDGRVEEAMQHLRQALALRPEFPEAENNLGENLRRLGRTGEALPHFRRAIDIQPGYAEAHHNLGAALMSLNQPAEGIAAFEEAIARKPTLALAHRDLGRAIATTRSPAMALPHFERAVELAPADAEAQIDLGFALLTLGRPAAAVPHLQTAVRLRSDFPEAHNILGRALGVAGDLEGAISHFAEAVRLNPAFEEARRNLAQARQQAGMAR